MPTYEYKCNTCGQRFEKIQRFSDAPLTECPSCGAEVRRVIQPTGIIFKGAGWYITDSRQSSDGGGDKGKGKGDAVGADNGKSEQGATPSTDKATDKVAATAADGKNSTTTAKAAASSDS